MPLAALPKLPADLETLKNNEGIQPSRTADETQRELDILAAEVNAAIQRCSDGIMAGFQSEASGYGRIVTELPSMSENRRFVPSGERASIPASAHMRVSQTVDPESTHTLMGRRRQQLTCGGSNEDFMKEESSGSHGLRSLTKLVPLDTPHTTLTSGAVDGGFSNVFGKDHSDIDGLVYRVESYYHSTGTCQSIARSVTFFYVTLVVISLNAVYLGVEADWNNAPTLYGGKAHWVFVVCENCFCIFFFGELMIRFMAFRRSRDSLRDGWFRFDLFLVTLMLLDSYFMTPLMILTNWAEPGKVSGNSPFRLLRLMRLTRLTRLARSFPELLTLTKSVIEGVRAVFSSLLLVVLMTYSFAILLQNIVQDLEGAPRGFAVYWRFDTIPRCMWTLWVTGALMADTGQVLAQLMLYGNTSSFIGGCLFMLYIMLSHITVMNMLIGILTEVVVRMAKMERDETAIRLIKETILTHLKRFDSGDGKISQQDLVNVILDPSSQAILSELNVDRLFLIEMQNLFFQDLRAKIEIRTAMELILMCRGELPVTVEHMALSQAGLIALLDEAAEQIQSNVTAAMQDNIVFIQSNNKKQSCSIARATLQGDAWSDQPLLAVGKALVNSDPKDGLHDV